MLQDEDWIAESALRERPFNVSIPCLPPDLGLDEVLRVVRPAHVREEVQQRPAEDAAAHLLVQQHRERVYAPELAKLTIFANVCKFLAGSFSAVSKRNFARKYAFDSIFRALQDLHTSAPLQSKIFTQ